MNPRDRRFLLGAAVVVVAVGGGAGFAGFPVELALGLALLLVAAVLFGRLHALGGWAPGAVGSYLFAAAALTLQITLAFIEWFDVWLAGLAGFGATVAVVTVACLPYLDRTHVADPSEDPPADGQPLRYEGRPLDRPGRLLLVAYSQIVVVANGLITLHTFRAH